MYQDPDYEDSAATGKLRTKHVKNVKSDNVIVMNTIVIVRIQHNVDVFCYMVSRLLCRV